MNKQEAVQKLFRMHKEIQAYNQALSLFHWDSTTGHFPVKSMAARGAAQQYLSEACFKIFIAPDTLACIETLEQEWDTLNEVEQAAVRELGRDYRREKAVPPEELGKFSALGAESEMVWQKAKAEDDFSLVQPYYEKIFDYQRRLCDWYGYEKHPYDALLDYYEKDATVEMLDGFFSVLKDKIVPILAEVKNKETVEINGKFAIDKQKSLGQWASTLMGFDFSRGGFGEVEHPYTITINYDDIRITTHYFEDILLSALYSTIHEAGHGIYEQNMPKKWANYGLCTHASMGMHESQSRFYENMIGRSRAFCSLLLPKLEELFPGDFKGWDETKLYQALNAAKPSLIRIEADELTYCLHIMVRYELEKQLISGTLAVKDLPEAWNSMYKEYLGITPKDNRTGVLQDMHWSHGNVGYFPTYAIGTAYAAQLHAAMKRSVDIDKAVTAGDIGQITKWLNTHVHQHGSFYTPKDLLQKATGEAFNPHYYADYLAEKFLTI